MTATRRAFLTLLCLALPLGACSRTPRPLGDGDLTMLRVENQAFLDMTIYVVFRGQRLRLGTAGGNRTTMLSLKSLNITGVETMRFIADPIGGNRLPTSDDILVSPGDVVTLTIPPQ